jgi:hypothetical protein
VSLQQSTDRIQTTLIGSLPALQIRDGSAARQRGRRSRAKTVQAHGLIRTSVWKPHRSQLTEHHILQRWWQVREPAALSTTQSSREERPLAPPSVPATLHKRRARPSPLSLSRHNGVGDMQDGNRCGSNGTSGVKTTPSLRMRPCSRTMPARDLLWYSATGIPAAIASPNAPPS